MAAKILIGALIIAISIGLFWIGNSQPLDCSKITSSKNIENCVGGKIEAVGTLQCQKPNIDMKAGVHYLIFDDKTELRFLEEYTKCNSADGQKVKVIGTYYKCGMNDQCSGFGLTNTSVYLIEY